MPTTPGTCEILKYAIQNESVFFAAIVMLIYTLIKLSKESIWGAAGGALVILVALYFQLIGIQTKMWKELAIEIKLSHIEKMLKDYNISSDDENYTTINDIINNNLPQNPFRAQKNK